MAENKTLAFKCDQCAEKFRTDDYVRIDLPSRDFHPYDYLAICPNCKHEGVVVEQWQINLFKAWSNATGPKNTDLSRFNAITHGLTAEVAQAHPARPGGYDACEGCEWLNNGCGDNGNKYCLKRTEIFMRHQLAADSGDITSLKKLFANSQASYQIILDNIIMAIARRGVEVHEPITMKNKNGQLEIAKIIDGESGKLVTLTTIKAHPLIKPLIEMMSKNGMSLSDMMLTQKQQGEDANLKGFLEDEQENREETRKRAELFAERQGKLLELVKNGKNPLDNIKHLQVGE